MAKTDLAGVRADLGKWVGDYLRDSQRDLETLEVEDMASTIAAGALHYASLAYAELGQGKRYSQCRLAALCLLARKDPSVYTLGLADLEEAKAVSKEMESLARQYERLSALGPQVSDEAPDGVARGASIEVYEAAALRLAEQMAGELEGPQGDLVEVGGAFELLGSRLLEAAAEINWRRKDIKGAIACWASLVLLDGIEEEFYPLRRIQPGYCSLMARHFKAMADSYLLERLFA